MLNSYMRTLVGPKPLNESLGLLNDVDTAGLTDGQVLKWNATLGKFQAATPAGTSEYARGENSTGTVTGPVAGAAGNFVSGGAVAVPNTDIIVAPTTRPVWLSACGLGVQTTLGTGLAFLEVWETTSTPVMWARTQGVVLPNLTTSDVRRNFDVYFKPQRLSTVTTQRSFQLRINCFGYVGQTPAWSLFNGNVDGFRTYLLAEQK